MCFCMYACLQNNGYINLHIQVYIHACTYVGTGITHFSRKKMTSSETTSKNKQSSGVIEGRFQLGQCSLYLLVLTKLLAIGYHKLFI